MATSLPGPPSIVLRALGIVGIVGGLALLAAFAVEIAPALNNVRIVLFLGGAIAIAVAVHPYHARQSKWFALAGAVPICLGNASYVAWVLLSVGRERPFAGDFGLVGFYAGLAFWLGDAWFGLVALRLRVLARPALVVLLVGSLLAITGIDRLELTSDASPTIFGPLSLLGAALNGLAWVLLGIEVALARRGPWSGSGSWPTRATGESGHA